MESVQIERDQPESIKNRVIFTMTIYEFFIGLSTFRRWRVDIVLWWTTGTPVKFSSVLYCSPQVVLLCDFDNLDAVWFDSLGAERNDRSKESYVFATREVIPSKKSLDAE